MPIQSIKSEILMFLLTITCVVVIVMALLMQFGFKQGFTQYKKSLEKDLNDPLLTLSKSEIFHERTDLMA